MGENLRRKSSPDRTRTENCGNDLSRSNSDASSLAAENSKDVFHKNVNANPGKCTAWTNEKHNLYLDQLEASFVGQLNRSMGLLASEQNKWDPNSSRRLPVNSNNSSEQFTVLQDGCWKKINFEKNQPLLNIAADSNVFRSPRRYHFRYAGNRCTVTSADHQQHSTLHGGRVDLKGKRTFSHRLASNMERSPVNYLCHHYSVGSITEVSGQNFVDEDREEKSSSLSDGKRLKTAITDISVRES
ncbi:unnamed protein product [Ilex paraguariensis]|uniref:Cold regulated protein 27 n=1 Tax=Ilex paraguariensis TaxID=185542 RepID=A0ABC8RBP9_9AQUA